MIYLFYLALIAVIGGHFAFAYMQWFKWKGLCRSVTDMSDEAIEQSAFLGRSIGSYNASIGVGLLLSFRLSDTAEYRVQLAVFAFIVLTAAVGAMGTKGNRILILRLLPAALAFILLWIVGPGA